MQGMELYVCFCRLAGQAGYFLWSTDPVGDAPDAIHVDASGKIPLFPTSIAARTYAESLGQSVAVDAPVDYDLERIEAWCRQPNEATLDCEAALNAWNLFADLPASAPSDLFAHVSRTASAEYDKLFHGNNLPSVTPPGHQFTPLWAADELTRLRQALELGLEAFVSRISLSDGV
jgi:hypothetical protein